MKTFSLSKFLLAASLSLGASAAMAAWPEGPIRLTVGFPPGTGPDIVARTVGDQLGTELGQSVVVENKAGAGGQIAAQSVARAKPDGYSLLLGEVGSMSITPETTANLPYDAINDFDPVTEAVRVNFVLVTPPDSPYKTLAEFVEAARKDGQQFNIATFGAGTPGHFGAEMLAEAANFRITPIHYRNTGDALTGIVSGQVQGAFITTAMAASQLSGGKMKALAITGDARSAMLPNIPTFAESGHPDVNFGAWFAFFTPKGTPAEVLDTLNSNIDKALDNAKVRKTLEDMGFVIVGSSRDELASLLQSEKKRWADVVKKTGFKIN